MSSINFSIHPPIIAHRGASAHAPENTLSAFRKAKELGLNWVEFDVMLSSDNEPVVIHDEQIDRTTNGQGSVIERTVEYLQSLDAGTWFNTQFAHEKIPTLRETLDFLCQMNMAANIEIKAQKGNEELTIKKILQVVDEHWKNIPSKLLLSSFSLPLLEKAREHSRLALGFLMDEWNVEWEKICDELECSTVNVNYEILTVQRVQEIKLSGRKILVYTVNDSSLACKLFSWGVDAVFSDCPAEIILDIK